ncbi:MAG: tyrosine-protein phosphatase [Oscillospiraceae bacterium]|nr:tyrosine-protein phosphatase [Oscillospiraceae bacterium]
MQNTQRFNSVIPLEGCFNFRDLGGYPFAGGVTLHKRLYRADDLCGLTDRDMVTMAALNIGCVIDLRQAHELALRPHPFAEKPNVDYCHIPMNDLLYAQGRPMFVEMPSSLSELYIWMLRMAGHKIADVMYAIIAHRDRPLVFHCAAGKDRTGVIAALLLELAGVCREDIVGDYSQSADNMAPKFAQMREEALQQGGEDTPEHLLGSAPEDIVKMLEVLQVEYGGAEAYLEKIGLDHEDIRLLKSVLCTQEQTAVGL